MKHLITVIVILSLAGSAYAVSEHRGKVLFGEVPVPGTVVRATQGDKTLRAVTDAEGVYSFADITEGAWAIEVEAPGFEIIRRDVVIASDSPAAQWNLKMLPLGDLKAGTSPGFPATTSSSPTLQVSTPSGDTADRLLINGSVVNGGSTPFALSPAFGNNRRGTRSLYTTNVLLTGNSSLFDARSFSLTGQNTPQPDYKRLQSSIMFGGPLQIPSLFRNGQFSVSYNRTQNRNANLQTVQVPTAAERAGDFLQSSSAISPQAKALLDLYPLPNFNGAGR